mmetsp:Transcript_103480/g.297302  ORF Transcript_103480/g.297302 Transcript_103480/m.297302 type:complete len:239 (-) Transcript_103480:536-1252(-)
MGPGDDDIHQLHPLRADGAVLRYRDGLELVLVVGGHDRGEVLVELRHFRLVSGQARLGRLLGVRGGLREFERDHVSEYVRAACRDAGEPDVGPYVRVDVDAGRFQGRWDPDAAGHVVKHAGDVVVPQGYEGRAAGSAGEGAVEVRVHVVHATGWAAFACRRRGAGERRRNDLRDGQAHGQVGGKHVVGYVEVRVSTSEEMDTRCGASAEALNTVTSRAGRVRRRSATSAASLRFMILP